MSWPKLLVLVRHAESEGNAMTTVDARAQSGMAPHAYPLTERGKQQARITGNYLKKKFKKFDIYYVSYYQRSRETMKTMFPDARVYEDSRLAEGQRGIWNIMTTEQIKLRFPEEFERKEREGLYFYRPFGGENWPDIELRIHSFLGTLSRDYGGKKVLIVAHGHWLILLQKLIHHFSIEEALSKRKNSCFENASVTTYKGIIRGRRSRLVLADENLIPWIGIL